MPRRQTHERFREDVSLPWKTAPAVSEPTAPLLELPSRRSSLRYTTKRRSRYFSLVKITRNLIFAITHSLERVERSSLQSFTLASPTFFFFFLWWNCVHIDEACFGKDSPGSKREGEGCARAL